MVRTDASTRLTELLGIRHPVLMAGMAGGLTTPDLVAGVSAAGALGVFGASGMTATTLAEHVAIAVERSGGAPVGVNVLLAPPAPAPPAGHPMHELLGELRAELGIPGEPPPRPTPGTALELLRAGLDAGATIASVALGDPTPGVAIAREFGVPCLAMVTNVADARSAEAAGVDVIVAQGAEAGGHRSEIPRDGAIALVGTAALVPQVVRAVSVPVVAAGGLMNGAGLVAAMALGAAGVQLGTRFLGAAESGASAAWKRRLATAADTDTVVTAAVTGRPARAIRNRLVELLAAPDAPGNLGWLRQGPAQADIVSAAGAAGRDELQFLLAGQAAGLESVGQTAGGIVARIMAEAAASLARFEH